MNLMRIDSCRTCGQELQITKLCISCNQPLHFDCSNCNAFIDEPVHQHDLTSQSFLQFGVNEKQKEVNL